MITLAILCGKLAKKAKLSVKQAKKQALGKKWSESG